ncbi:MAG: helix-turn-helix domain-containing protein [Tannerella sp.]|nr:helix-turn-helix domain-containing protein [Tannerella sp.]
MGRKPGLSDETKVTTKRAEKLYNSDDYSTREICEILNISSRTLYKYLKYLNVEKRSDKI